MFTFNLVLTAVVLVFAAANNPVPHDNNESPAPIGNVEILTNPTFTLRLYETGQDINSHFYQNPLIIIPGLPSRSLKGSDKLRMYLPPERKIFYWELTGFFKAPNTRRISFRALNALVAKVQFGYKKGYTHNLPGPIQEIISEELIDATSRNHDFDCIPGEIYPIRFSLVLEDLDVQLTYQTDSPPPRLLHGIQQAELQQDISHNRDPRHPRFIERGFEYRTSVFSFHESDPGKYMRTPDQIMGTGYTGPEFSGSLTPKVHIPYAVEIWGHINVPKTGLYSLKLPSDFTSAFQIGEPSRKKGRNYAIQDKWRLVDSRINPQSRFHLLKNRFYPFRIIILGNENKPDAQWSVELFDPQGKKIDIFAMSKSANVDEQNDTPDDSLKSYDEVPGEDSLRMKVLDGFSKNEPVVYESDGKIYTPKPPKKTRTKTPKFEKNEQERLNVLVDYPKDQDVTINVAGSLDSNSEISGTWSPSKESQFFVSGMNRTFITDASAKEIALGNIVGLGGSPDGGMFKTVERGLPSKVTTDLKVAKDQNETSNEPLKGKDPNKKNEDMAGHTKVVSEANSNNKSVTNEVTVNPGLARSNVSIEVVLLEDDESKKGFVPHDTLSGKSSLIEKKTRVQELDQITSDKDSSKKDTAKGAEKKSSINRDSVKPKDVPEDGDPKGKEPKGKEPKGKDPKGKDTNDGDLKDGVSKGIEKKGGYPKGIATKGKGPKGADLEVAVSKDTNPQETGPEGYVPKGIKPQGKGLEVGIPKGTNPKGTELEVAISKGTDSKGVDLKGGASKGTTPKSTDLKGTDPEGKEPKATDPSAEKSGGHLAGGDQKGTKPRAETGDPKHEDPKGTEPKGAEPKVTDSKGEHSKDGIPKKDKKFGDPKGTKPEGTKPKGTELNFGQPKGEDPKVTDTKFTNPKVTDPKISGSAGGVPKGTDGKVTDPKGKVQENKESKNGDSNGGGSKAEDQKVEEPKRSHTKFGDSKVVVPKDEEAKGSDPEFGDPKDARARGTDKGQGSEGKDQKGKDQEGADPKSGYLKNGVLIGKHANVEDSKGGDSKDEDPIGEGPNGKDQIGKDPKFGNSTGGTPKGTAPNTTEPKGSDPKLPEPKIGDPRAGDPIDGGKNSMDPKAGDSKTKDSKEENQQGIELNGTDLKRTGPNGTDPKGGIPTNRVSNGAEQKVGDPKGADPKAEGSEGGSQKGGDPKITESKDDDPKDTVPDGKHQEFPEPKGEEPRGGPGNLSGSSTSIEVNKESSSQNPSSDLLDKNVTPERNVLELVSQLGKLKDVISIESPKEKSNVQSLGTDETKQDPKHDTVSSNATEINAERLNQDVLKSSIPRNDTQPKELPEPEESIETVESSKAKSLPDTDTVQGMETKNVSQVSNSDIYLNVLVPETVVISENKTDASASKPDVIRDNPEAGKDINEGESVLQITPHGFPEINVIQNTTLGIRNKEHDILDGVVSDNKLIEPVLGVQENRSQILGTEMYAPGSSKDLQNTNSHISLDPIAKTLEPHKSEQRVIVSERAGQAKLNDKEEVNQKSESYLRSDNSTRKESSLSEVPEISSGLLAANAIKLHEINTIPIDQIALDSGANSDDNHTNVERISHQELEHQPKPPNESIHKGPIDVFNLGERVVRFNESSIYSNGNELLSVPDYEKQVLERYIIEADMDTHHFTEPDSLSVNNSESSVVKETKVKEEKTPYFKKKETAVSQNNTLIDAFKNSTLEASNASDSLSDLVGHNDLVILLKEKIGRPPDLSADEITKQSVFESPNIDASSDGNADHSAKAVTDVLNNQPEVNEKNEANPSWYALRNKTDWIPEKLNVSVLRDSSLAKYFPQNDTTDRPSPLEQSVLYRKFVSKAATSDIRLEQKQIADWLGANNSAPQQQEDERLKQSFKNQSNDIDNDGGYANLTTNSSSNMLQEDIADEQESHKISLDALVSSQEFPTDSLGESNFQEPQRFTTSDTLNSTSRPCHRLGKVGDMRDTRNTLHPVSWPDLCCERGKLVFNRYENLTMDGSTKVSGLDQKFKNSTRNIAWLWLLPSESKPELKKDCWSTMNRISCSAENGEIERNGRIVPQNDHATFPNTGVFRSEHKEERYQLPDDMKADPDLEESPGTARTEFLGAWWDKSIGPEADSVSFQNDPILNNFQVPFLALKVEKTAGVSGHSKSETSQECGLSFDGFEVPETYISSCAEAIPWGSSPWNTSQVKEMANISTTFACIELGTDPENVASIVPDNMHAGSSENVIKGSSGRIPITSDSPLIESSTRLTGTPYFEWLGVKNDELVTFADRMEKTTHVTSAETNKYNAGARNNDAKRAKILAMVLLIIVGIYF